MSDQLRRMEKERKLNDITRKSSKSRVLTKEFSSPVKAANALVARKMEDIISKEEKMSRLNQFRYDRECDYINDLRKTLVVKLKDFDGDEFHRDRLENRKCSSLRISSDRDIIAMMMAIPTNSVLDFGPGNKAIHSFDPELKKVSTVKHERVLKRPKQTIPTPMKPSWQRKNIKSKYSKYFRAQSARLPKTETDKKNIQQKPRPQTSIPRVSRATESNLASSSVFALRSNCSFTTSQKGKQHVNFGRNPVQQSDVTSETGSTETSSTDDYKRSKSYRTLKTMFMYKDEDETPIPDPHEEFRKRCKNRETLYYQLLQRRVENFIKSIHTCTRGDSVRVY